MSDPKKTIRVNRALSKYASFGALDSTHLLPFSMSLVFGMVVGQVFNLNFLWHLLLIIWPFGTWLIVSGRNPKRFMAQTQPAPRWKRRRILHADPLHKSRAGRVRY